MMLDTHHHLDFLPVPVRTALLKQLGERGIQVVAQTVRPSDFQEVEAVAPLASLGFHPWYVGDSGDVTTELDVFAEAVRRTRFIGEVGLDLSPRRVVEVAPTRQIEVLRRLLGLVCEATQTRGGEPSVVSVHAVRSAGLVLDVLEELDAVRRGVVPVLHRFSGTSDDLTRLARMGGMISVSPVLLASKRGRAYIRQVPANRLLLETDLPIRVLGDVAAADVDAVASEQADAVCASLEQSMRGLLELLGEGIIASVQENQALLYGV